MNRRSFLLGSAATVAAVAMPSAPVVSRTPGIPLAMARRWIERDEMLKMFPVADPPPGALAYIDWYDEARQQIARTFLMPEDVLRTDILRPTAIETEEKLKVVDNPG